MDKKPPKDSLKKVQPGKGEWGWRESSIALHSLTAKELEPIGFIDDATRQIDRTRTSRYVVIYQVLRIRHRPKKRKKSCCYKISFLSLFLLIFTSQEHVVIDFIGQLYT